MGSNKQDPSGGMAYQVEFNIPRRVLGAEKVELHVRRGKSAAFLSQMVPLDGSLRRAEKGTGWFELGASL
jgi:hypothetical protein